MKTSRRILCFVFALALVVPAGACGSDDDEVVGPQKQAQVYEEGFEGYSKGSLVGQGGWSLRGTAGSALQLMISDEQAKEGKQSLRLLTGPGDKVSVKRDIGKLGEAFYLEGSLMRLKEGGSAFIGLEADAGAADSGDLPPLIAIAINAEGVAQLIVGEDAHNTHIGFNPLLWARFKLRIWRESDDRVGGQLLINDKDSGLVIAQVLGQVVFGLVYYRLVVGGSGAQTYYDVIKAGRLEY